MCLSDPAQAGANGNGHGLQMHADQGVTHIDPRIGADLFHKNGILQMTIRMRRHGSARFQDGNGRHFWPAESFSRPPLDNESAVQMLTTLKGEVEAPLFLHITYPRKQSGSNLLAAG
jgi:hypothetical protein